MSYNTLAGNHLSELANKGRGGDTELRIVDGELSHVNTDEAAAIDMYGSVGEDVVKVVGSGTINPSTGLKEYQIDPFSAGMFGLSAYQYIAGAQSERDQARVQSQLIDKQLTGLQGSMDQLGGVKETKIGAAREEYELGLGQLGMKTGQTMQTIQQQYESAIGKGKGLATAGGAERYKSLSLGSTRNVYTSQREGLMGQLGKVLGGVEEWYAGEQARLGSEKTRLQYEKRMQQQKLGRGLFG